MVFDAISAAKAQGRGRDPLRHGGTAAQQGEPDERAGKISRIIDRELPDAAKEVLLVLDGTTGQNGLLQAKQFKEIAGVTAIALTKLDGTAKGGIVIAVADALQIPVKFIGVGEQIGRPDAVQREGIRGSVDLRKYHESSFGKQKQT